MILNLLWKFSVPDDKDALNLRLFEEEYKEIERLYRSNPDNQEIRIEYLLHRYNHKDFRINCSEVTDFLKQMKTIIELQKEFDENYDQYDSNKQKEFLQRFQSGCFRDGVDELEFWFKRLLENKTFKRKYIDDASKLIDKILELKGHTDIIVDQNDPRYDAITAIEQQYNAKSKTCREYKKELLELDIVIHEYNNFKVIKEEFFTKIDQAKQAHVVKPQINSDSAANNWRQYQRSKSMPNIEINRDYFN